MSYRHCLARLKGTGPLWLRILFAQYYIFDIFNIQATFLVKVLSNTNDIFHIHILRKKEEIWVNPMT